MTYTIVAVCILLLKYEEESGRTFVFQQGFLSKLFNLIRLEASTQFTFKLVAAAAFVFICSSISMSLLISFAGGKILDGDILWIVLLSLLVILILLTMIVIACQPRSSKASWFNVPCTPWLPAISIMLNIHLLVQIEATAWIRFGVWILVGILHYLLYVRRHSRIMKNALSEQFIRYSFESAARNAFEEIDENSLLVP